MPEVGVNMGDTCWNARSGRVTWDSKRPGSLPLCPRGIGVWGEDTVSLCFLTNKAFLVAWEGLIAHAIVWGGYAGALN